MIVGCGEVGVGQESVVIDEEHLGYLVCSL